MNFDDFCHARIVGEQPLRGYPLDKLLSRPMNLLIEFFPLVLFLAAYMYKDIYLALIVLMVAMPVALLIKYLRTRSLDKMFFWSTVFLLVAGGFTLYFRNPLILKWKPTVFYWVVALAFLGSQFLSDKPLAQRLFGLVDGFSLEKITHTQWTKLNIAWVFFAVAAGILNIYVAYNFDEATWVKFKVFWLTAITFVFLFAQTLWIANIIGDDEEQELE